MHETDENNLKDVLRENPIMTPKEAVDVVKDVQSSTKNAIESNPNTKINDLKLEQQVVPVDNTNVVTPADPIKIKYKNPWEA